MQRVAAPKESQINTDAHNKNNSVHKLREILAKIKPCMDPQEEATVAKGGKDAVARNDWLTNFCRTMGFLTSFCALLCLMAFATALFHDTTEAQAAEEPLSGRRDVVPIWESKAQTVSEHVLRMAGVVCSIVVILAETEWERFLQYFAFLDFWISRGLFQLTVAALTQCMAHAEGNSDLARSVSLYRNIASTSLACCGAFYILAGMVCIGAMRRARRRRDLERLRMMQDLEDVERQLGDVERRRLELKSLLGPETGSRSD